MSCCDALKFTRGEIYFSPLPECNVFCDSEETLFKKLGKLISAEVVNSSEIVGVESPFHLNYNHNARRTVGPSTLNLVFYWDRNFLTDLSEVDSGTFTQAIECGGFEIKSGQSFVLKKSGIDTESIQVFIDDSDLETTTELVLDVDYEIKRNLVTFIRDIALNENERVRVVYDYSGNQSLLSLDRDVLLSGSLYFSGVNMGDEKKPFNVRFNRCFFSIDASLTLVDDGQFSQSNINVRIEIDKNKRYYEITE